jgi:hypothetical protein
LISEILSSGIKTANNSNLHCYETGKTNISGRVGPGSILTDIFSKKIPQNL